MAILVTRIENKIVAWGITIVILTCQLASSGTTGYVQIFKEFPFVFAVALSELLKTVNKSKSPILSIHSNPLVDRTGSKKGKLW